MQIKKKLLMKFVVPKSPSKWGVGKVVGMKCFNLSIGPILIIRDIFTGKRYNALPREVDRLVREE